MKIIYVRLLVALLGLGILSSCGSNKIPGATGPWLTTTEEHVVVGLDIHNLNLNDSVSIQIPRIHNSFIEATPSSASGGTVLNVKIDASELANGSITTENPMTLPGGRPLPTINGGILPGLAVEVPKFKEVRVYAGPKIYAVFIPINFPVEVPGIIMQDLKIGGKKAGRIALVGQDQTGENSGALIMLDLNSKGGKMMQKMMLKKF